MKAAGFTTTLQLMGPRTHAVPPACGYPGAREMAAMSVLRGPGGTRVLRAWALVAIAGLLMMAALSVRAHISPELRKATGGETSSSFQTATRSAVEHDTQGRGGIIDSPGHAHLVALATPWKYAPAATLWVVLVLVLVATALGMPKRLRWAMLGGHGRHGAG